MNHGRSRVKMRQRPIDSSKPLPIAETPDVNLEELQQKKAKGLEIPVPPVNFAPVSDYDKSKEDWEQPEHYIKFHLSSGSNRMVATHPYELEMEDLEWLQRYNQDNKRGQKPMGEDEMETMINIFERECARIMKDTVNAQSDCDPAYIDPTSHYTYEEHGSAHVAEQTNARGRKVEAVFSYWMAKRKRLRKALVRDFQLPPNPENPSPHVAFRPRVTQRRVSQRTTKQAPRHPQGPRKNDPSAYYKMKYLKRDFDRLFTIFQVLEDRENLKKDQNLLDIHIFDQQLAQTPWAKSLVNPPPQLAAALKTSVPQAGFMLKSDQTMPIRPAKPRASVKKKKPKSRPRPPVRRPPEPKQTPRPGTPELDLYESSEDSEEILSETSGDEAYYAEVEQYIENWRQEQIEDGIWPEDFEAQEMGNPEVQYALSSQVLQPGIPPFGELLGPPRPRTLLPNSPSLLRLTSPATIPPLSPSPFPSPVALSDSHDLPTLSVLSSSSSSSSSSISSPLSSPTSSMMTPEKLKIERSLSLPGLETVSSPFNSSTQDNIIVTSLSLSTEPVSPSTLPTLPTLPTGLPSPPHEIYDDELFPPRKRKKKKQNQNKEGKNLQF